MKFFKNNNPEKTYHFCAMHQNENSAQHFFSGIIRCDIDLTTKEGYDALNKSISSEMIPSRDPDKIIILSLSRIN